LPEAYAAAHKVSNGKRRHARGGTSKPTCEPPFIHCNVRLTHHHSPILSRSSKIIFSVLCGNIFGEKCLGMCDIDVEELVERQSQQADGGKCIPFC
jgi:hypothetical protein